MSHAVLPYLVPLANALREFVTGFYVLRQYRVRFVFQQQRIDIENFIKRDEEILVNNITTTGRSSPHRRVYEIIRINHA